MIEKNKQSAAAVASAAASVSESEELDDASTADDALDSSAEKRKITCSRCNVEKDAADYGKQERTRGLKGNKARCIKCVAFRSMLKQKFGITLVDFDAKLIAQKNVCGYCKKEPVDDKSKIDYCEKTCTFRGVLCDKCFGLVKTLGDPAVDNAVALLVYIAKNSQTLSDQAASEKVFVVCEAFGVLVKEHR